MRNFGECMKSMSILDKFWTKIRLPPLKGKKLKEYLAA
jgi:hypothetical protein